MRIETERLLLRPFEPDDWVGLLAYMSDPDVLRYLPWEPFSELEAKALVREAMEAARGEDGPRRLATVLKAEDRLIGTMVFGHFSPKYRTREIGYIFHRDYQGQGYATEAGQALLAYAFEELGLHRMIATCDPRNPASFRVMEKLGMRREAHFIKDVIIHGEWADEYFYAILEEEWWERCR